MTAAAARKKEIEEPDSEPADDRRSGMWIDGDNLPTTLAQIGKKKELQPLERWTSLDRDDPPNRLLRYADMMLGTLEERRRKPRKKRKK